MGIFTDLLGQSPSYSTLNKKHYTEALESGFTLLTEQPVSINGVQNYNYKTYICNTCGWVDYYQPTHIRRKHCKCDKCFLDCVKTDAAKQGLILVKHQPDPLPTLFRREDCGHTVEHSRQAMRGMSNRKSDFSTCKQCYIQKIRDTTSQKGLEEITPPANAKSKAQFIVKDCGHTVHSTYTNLLNNIPACNTCRNNLRSTEVQSQQLKYLSKSPNGSSLGHHLYELPCGHTKSMRLDKARESIWECRECQVSHLDKPSMLYLLHFKQAAFQWLKLGYARNLSARISGYGVGETPYTVEYLQELPSGQQVKDFEIALHKTLKKYKINKTLMKSFHTNNGASECYPVEELGRIVKLIQERISD